MDEFHGTSYGVIALGLLALWVVLRLSSKLGRRRKADANANQTLPGLQFPLRSANSVTEIYDHFFVAMAVVGSLVVGVLYVVGRASGEDVLTLVGFLLLMSLVSAWGMRRMFRGVAEVGPSGLTVRAGGKTFVFRWNNIAETRVTDWASTPGLDGLWARLLRTDLRAPFIYLRLSRRLRMNDLLSQYSTDGDGIPTFKEYRIFIDNPATLADIIASYMRETRNQNAVPA